MWHEQTAAAVIAQLHTDADQGLSANEARRRMARYGPNELRGTERVSPWPILVTQLKNVLVLILLIAVALSLLLGHGLEAAAIGVIVLFAVALGFLQEFRAERAIEALRAMAAPTASAVRDGREGEIAARDLVPGDIISLRAGHRVPADARLVEAVNLQAEEAPLTGESVAVEKHTEPVPGAAVAVGDRRNMVYAGTVIAYGRGKAVVVATAAQTEFGKIAQLLRSVESERTPLQENLDRVGRKLAVAAVLVVVLVVALGTVRGQPWLEMLLFGIALAVAVVPEALPAVVTISLAIGVQRMVKRHALIRRLAAVETLGCISVICSDKTGTLTKDEMTVRKIICAGRTIDVGGAGYEPRGDFMEGGASIDPPAALTALLRAAALSSDARVMASPDGSGWQLHGDPTEGALVVAAAKAGLERGQLDAQYPRVAEIPFDSSTKRMTTLHRTPDCGTVAYVKGAPEVILRSCESQVLDEAVRPLESADREQLLRRVSELSNQALRVLGVAEKPRAPLENTDEGLTFLGLVGIMDPPRPEARAAIHTCEAAGIKPVMITGDHPLTARAVAAELGILRSGRVVSGAELADMDAEELARTAPDIEVYARVSPADKLRVVTALQQRGQCVAMTGDGVNDAPALKRASVGIAMGITGTDVSREAAAMTLTDDNFASIVAAIEEGRAVFDNIKKYLMYLLSSNIGEILLMAGAVLCGLPLPLTAVQILYVNLATDGLPALALALDPPDDDLMRRPPRKPHVGIFSPPVVALLIIGGVWSAVMNLALFAWALRSGRDVTEAMTMTFVSLVLIQFFKAYNFRSEHRSVLHRPFANRWLNVAIGWELGLLALLVYVPFLHAPFGTFPLTATDWVIVLGLALTISPVLEAAKWTGRRGWWESGPARGTSSGPP
ncbi:MAG: cation-translocating P-type ATPase [Candidatus Binatia bacterium]